MVIIAELCGRLEPGQPANKQINPCFKPIINILLSQPEWLLPASLSMYTILMLSIVVSRGR